ncbi:MAG: hypothetical protein AB7O73_01600 [Bacteroidia bacterium]
MAKKSTAKPKTTKSKPASKPAKKTTTSRGLFGTGGPVKGKGKK